MDTKNIVVTALISVIVVALGISVAPVKQETIDRTVTEVQNVGALAGPDIPSPYLNWGGTNVWQASGSWKTATSAVLCSIQNPAGATTSLDAFVAHISSNGLGAQALVVATSGTRYATTTNDTLKTTSIAASGRLDIVVAGASGNVWAPNDFLLLAVATGTPGTFSSYTNGTCHTTGNQL